MHDYYREIMIWRRVSEAECLRYSCFQSLTTHRYIVQSIDHFPFPIDEETMRYLSHQFVELFIDSEPSERSQSFDSLVDAIHAFENDFGMLL